MRDEMKFGLILLIIALILGSWGAGRQRGFRAGQIAYAMDDIQWTVNDFGYIIHVEGKAPLPETKLKEITK